MLAGMGTGNGQLVISGTSMACPMTAGIAALVKQAHPAWTGLQIKAAIMNTADRSLNTGYNVRRAGAGVVQAQKAVNSSVLATTANQLDSIAFGYVPGSGDYTDHKAITLTNKTRYGNSVSLFTQSGAAARAFRERIQAGMLGINLGVPAPMAFFSFGGWKQSIFGDLHAHGPDAVAFYTRKKVVTERWFGAEAPKDGWV